MKKTIYTVTLTVEMRDARVFRAKLNDTEWCQAAFDSWKLPKGITTQEALRCLVDTIVSRTLSYDLPGALVTVADSSVKEV